MARYNRLWVVGSIVNKWNFGYFQRAKWLILVCEKLVSYYHGWQAGNYYLYLFAFEATWKYDWHLVVSKKAILSHMCVHWCHQITNKQTCLSKSGEYDIWTIMKWLVIWNIMKNYTHEAPTLYEILWKPMKFNIISFVMKI